MPRYSVFMGIGMDPDGELDMSIDLDIFDTDNSTTGADSNSSTSLMMENKHKRSHKSIVKKKSTEDCIKKRTFLIRRSNMTPLERAVEDKQFLDRYRFTFSRLLYSDIRRRYAQMYTNVLNSNDPALVRKFFRQFTVPRVQFFNYMANQVYNLPPIILSDQQAVADVYVSFLDPKVDAITTLLECRVIRHYDTKTSDLSFLVRFTAHHVEHVTSAQESVVKHEREETNHTNTHTYTPSHTLSHTHSSTHTHTQQIQVSSVDFYCKTTFSLNDLNQITNIHLLGRSVEGVHHTRHVGVGIDRSGGGSGGLMDMLFPVDAERVT
ncbi:hypothetical protein EON63_23620 [archaeon]|nr:MAG: hypothetical protein EON63_23620 [archaeon]